MGHTRLNNGYKLFNGDGRVSFLTKKKGRKFIFPWNIIFIFSLFIFSMDGLADEILIPAVGSWSMDGDTIDRSGNNNDGYLSGAAELVDDVLKLNNIADRLVIPNNTYLDMTNTNHSFSLWFKADGTGQGRLLERLSGGAIGAGYALLLNDGQLVFEMRLTTGGVTISSPLTSAYNDGQWHHVGITVDIAHKVIRLYVDGTEVNKVSYTGNLIDKAGSELLVGHFMAQVSGMLDELAIYHHLLSATDVQILATKRITPPPSSQAVPKGHWKMDGNNLDSSGNHNDGYLFGSATFLNNTLTLNNNLDRMVIPDNVYLDVANSNHSFSLWFKADTNGEGRLLERLSGGAIGAGYVLLLRDGRVIFETRSTQESVITNSPASISYQDNEWHHVVVTVDISHKKVQLYIDARHVNSTSYRGDLIDKTGSELFIGLFMSHVAGAIDDVRIYHQLLSTNQIHSLATDGSKHPRLNDTGVTRLHGDDAGQDALLGRDARPETNDNSDGYKGFSFLKLGYDGQPLAIQNQAWSETGNEAAGTKWSCVEDKTTGLVWKLDRSNTSTAVCGITDWHNPLREELHSIVNYEIDHEVEDGSIWWPVGKPKKIDSDYFPYDFEMVSSKGNTSEYSWILEGSIPFAETIAKRAYQGPKVHRRYSFATEATTLQCNHMDPDFPATTLHLKDNGDGTVSDNKTGLMWKKCGERQHWNATNNQCEGSPRIEYPFVFPFEVETFTWEGALKQAVAVNSGTSGENLGKHDWRVPNIKELSSIVEEKCWFPAVNSAIFPLTRVYGVYWSSSQAVSVRNGGGLYVNFATGGDYQDQGDGYFHRKHYVRLVRDK